MISQNRFHDQDATLLKIPDLPSRNPNRSVKLPVFHWFFPPGNLLNRLPCLVTVGCLGKIGGVFGVKQVLKTNGWSLKNPLIRPSFLEVVGIEVLLNSHENKDITNTVLNFFFLEAIQSNIIEALQDTLRYHARKEWHQILFPSTSHQRRSQLCSNLIMLATNLSKEKEVLNI